MTVAVPLATLALLVCVSLVAGVGITAVGPGGIFVTVALFALTDLPPAVVVGTASATFVATGLLGTLSYYRSGELDSVTGARTAAILSVTGLVGALVGVRLNAFVDADAFGLLLGGLVTLTGALVFVRTRRGDTNDPDADADTRGDGGAVSASGNLLVTAAIGGFVGVAGGLVGVGGPVLAVPLLVASGVPMLLAVGVAQVQSVFVSAFATAGYVARDSVSWWLAVAIGVPELVGAVGGWRVAQSVDDDRLTRVLAALMLVLGPYIAFG